MVQPVPIKVILQSAKAAALCTACLEYARPPPSIPLFLLAQNLPFETNFVGSARGQGVRQQGGEKDMGCLNSREQPVILISVAYYSTAS